MPFVENEAGSLIFMTSSNIAAPHAFTTRHGGASGGIYTSLNLGQNVGDAPENVRRNYEIFAAALGFDPERVALSRQVHGTTIRLVTQENVISPFMPVPYEADGLITAEKDIPLLIFTADCVPILLHDPVCGAIGAVHAGWRGTVADIIGHAVRKMTASFGSNPSDIRAAIGPCISQCCYETGDDVKDGVYNILGAEAALFIGSRGDKHMVDLKGVNRRLLERSGLKPENIEISPECTSCLSDKYWSHRVTKGRRGSQASAIMMKGV